MSTRIIKLKLLSQTELVKVETSARTLGDFKAEPAVQALEIDWSSSQLVDKVTKATFNLDEAVLPAVDCIIFHFPIKTKSGTMDYKTAKAEIKKLKESGIGIPFNYTHASTESMVKFLESYDALKDSSELNENESNVQEDFSKLKEKVNAVLDEVSDFLENIEIVEETITEDLVEDTVINNIVECITFEDLQSEYNEIKAKLK